MNINAFNVADLGYSNKYSFGGKIKKMEVGEKHANRHAGNSDGRLSKDEVNQALYKLQDDIKAHKFKKGVLDKYQETIAALEEFKTNFEELDTNHDGFITKTEDGKTMSNKDLMKSFQLADRGYENKKGIGGKVNRIKVGHNLEFARWTGNADNKLSQYEINQSLANLQSDVAQYRHKKSAKKVAQNAIDFLSTLQHDFTKFDTNKDGLLSQSEAYRQ